MSCAATVTTDGEVAPRRGSVVGSSGVDEEEGLLHFCRKKHLFLHTAAAALLKNRTNCPSRSMSVVLLSTLRRVSGTWQYIRRAVPRSLDVDWSKAYGVLSPV